MDERRGFLKMLGAAVASICAIPVTAAVLGERKSGITLQSAEMGEVGITLDHTDNGVVMQTNDRSPIWPELVKGETYWLIDMTGRAYLVRYVLDRESDKHPVFEEIEQRFFDGEKYVYANVSKGIPLPKWYTQAVDLSKRLEKMTGEASSWGNRQFLCDRPVHPGYLKEQSLLSAGMKGIMHVAAEDSIRVHEYHVPYLVRTDAKDLVQLNEYHNSRKLA